MRLPGPPPEPYFGNYKEIAKCGIRNAVEKWMSQYGPTFIYYLGINTVIATQDMEVIKSIMVKNFDCFVNRIGLPTPYKKGKVAILPLMRDGQWRSIRHVLTPTFSSKRLRMMVPFIEDTCRRLKTKMEAVLDTEDSTNVSILFGMFTLENILSTAFSRDIDLDSGNENPLITAALSIFQSTRRSGANNNAGEKLLMLMSHFPWIKHLLRYVARRTTVARSWDYVEDAALKMTEDRIDAMKNGDVVHDLLQMMLEARDENRDTYPLSNDEIVTTVMTVMLAGFETTGSTLSFLAYELALNPDVQDKLIKEINDYFDLNPDASLNDAADNIEYVNMLMNEVMRMYPVVTPSRECKQTCAVTDDLVIEKGTLISVPLFLLHRNPKYWPNPDKFDPERFNPNKEPTYPTYAYLPFGDGPRYCLGKRYALLQSKMAIVSVFRDMHFERAPDTDVPLGVCQGFTLNPVNPIKLCIVSNP